MKILLAAERSEGGLRAEYGLPYMLGKGGAATCDGGWPRAAAQAVRLLQGSDGLRGLRSRHLQSCNVSLHGMRQRP
ncbi:hypothetical protein V7S43_005598 [Phytophthora oleae]|uniref:Uncharacterized protein n=1 Tax=Phytophthora oleae TaxID=2107226 RepID=A0ABD3FU39_9STRA